MRTVRNITVAVEPELYRQTRRIAADCDTTLTDMVRFLILVLPEAVKAARYPAAGGNFGLAAARAARARCFGRPQARPEPVQSSLEKSEISPCTPVNASKLHSLQQLAGQQPASVQDSISVSQPLKSIHLKYFASHSRKSRISTAVHQ